MEGIAKNLNQAFVNDKVKLLKSIANDYNLDPRELIEKYVDSTEITPGALVKNKKHGQASSQKKRNEFVETEEFVHNGETFLIDNRNQIYTYNVERPMMVGERLADGTVKFFARFLQMREANPA